MGRKVSPRRFELLALIRQNPRASLRELMVEMGFKSTSVVDYHLKKLEQAGEIVRSGNQARSIRLAGDPEPVVWHDHRKNNSQATRAKKSAAGRLGRGVNAFAGRSKSEKRTHEQELIDRVVADALAREGTGVDVVRDYPRGVTLRATKLG